MLYVKKEITIKNSFNTVIETEENCKQRRKLNKWRKEKQRSKEYTDQSGNEQNGNNAGARKVRNKKEEENKIC